MDLPTEFDARIGEGEVTLAQRDVELLRAIDDAGSIHRAAESLGRSYARAQQRVVELEEAFGPLVERTRGGAGGGGSTLTDGARDLLTQYERLYVEFSSVAETADTVLTGTVVDRNGELATIETPVGRLLALVPAAGETVRLTIRADGVTLNTPEESPAGADTSARNRLTGEVVAIDTGEAVAVVRVDVGGETPIAAIVTMDSVERLGLEVGATVEASFKATATHGVPAE
jgi:molybdate transport system regulatory protein